MNRPSDRTALAAILLLALAVRLWSVATHTYLAYPDETFQYLEPAHRLAFGSGVITWEFVEGIRSWLLPGAIAGAMRVAALFADSPDTYILPLRLLCVLASLVVPFVGFRMVERQMGSWAGIAAGLLCALSPQAIYFAPVIMTEPLATDAAFLAIWLGERASGTRRLLIAGALFGLATALRYQYLPVLGLVALWQHARDRRRRVLVLAGGSAVVLLVFGVLDTVTWGAPFRSVWSNFLRNGPDGISTAMGTGPWEYYFKYCLAAWGGLPVLLLVLGCALAPIWGIVIVGTLVLHTLVPHKELRFIFLANAAIPIAVAIGLTHALRWLRVARGRWLPVAAASALALLIAYQTASNATDPDQWHRDRSMLQAIATARAIPDACGIAMRTVWVYRTGGYSYWHRDAPIYFESWERAQNVPFTDFHLPLVDMLRGETVPQYPDKELAAHASKFNVIVGRRADGLAGFAERHCVGVGTPDDTEWCVFFRPGGCE